MPYVKPLEKPHAKFRRLLRGYEVNESRLKDILDCCWNTAHARLENLDSLTLGDIRKIRREAHIPEEEIKDSISF